MPRGQLTIDERYLVTHLHAAGLTPAQIGRRPGRHRATIGRELARNRDAFGSYHYLDAQAQATARRLRANQRYKLDRSALGEAVRDGLRQRWSPEQIVGRLRREHRGAACWRVSPETIYRWVYRQHALGHSWYQQLRRRRPRRRKRVVGQRRADRGRIPGRVGIEQRPAIVQTRRRFGDWESDTLEGAKGAGLLVTHLERKSRYLRIGKLRDKRAAGLTAVSCQLLGGLPKPLRRTLTADNGKEFADFASIRERLQMAFYFANPHAPWERGANENANGLLREFFPKGSNFHAITHTQLATAQRMLNNRPRKCLNYRTPLEVLNALPGVALRN